MDRYRVTVEWFPEPSTSVDLSSAVSGAVQITNGRTDLTASIGQNYASLTFLKTRLWDLVEAEGFSRTAFSFGALVTVSIGETMTSSDAVLFVGNITDMSSDAYEITFSLVSNYVYRMTGFFPYSYGGASGDTISNVIYNVASNTGGGLVELWTNYSEVIVNLDPAEITNGLTYLSGIVNQAPSQYLFVDPYRDAWQLTERPNTEDLPTIVLAGDDVLLDYSLDRSVEDVSNRVSVVYEGGTFERTNETSVDRIGQRFQQITTSIVNEDGAEKLGTWFLGAHAPDGFPIVTFRTSAELLGLPAPYLAENLQPNRLLDLTAVEAEGFEDFAYIEQTRYSITRSAWTMEIIASNSGYSELPQTWEEVSAGLEWGDIDGDSPDALTWDDLLYVRL
jgi:hypothetical protein